MTPYSIAHGQLTYHKARGQQSDAQQGSPAIAQQCQLVVYLERNGCILHDEQPGHGPAL